MPPEFAAFRIWYIRQRLRLRELRRICLKQTIIPAALWFLGFALIVTVPLPPPALTLALLAVGLLPPLILLIWLIHVPAVWEIHASIVALGLLAVTTVLSLVGRLLSGMMLNDIFAEAPTFFPIAFDVGTFFGTVLTMMSVISAITVVVFVLNLVFIFVVEASRPFRAIWQRPRSSRRRGWYHFGGNLIYALVALAAASSLIFLADRSESILRVVAIEADFFPDHRCETSGWPEGITRVAFVGDEQVLGYHGAEDRILVLSCHRRTVESGGPR